MSVQPFSIQVYRAGKWTETQTIKLLPGDVVSLVCGQHETMVPADILRVNGTCIVNEVMLLGGSTLLLKELTQLIEAREALDVDGQHKNEVLFSGTKVLQASLSVQIGSRAV